MARLLALVGPIVPQSHPRFGLKTPEGLTSYSRGMDKPPST